jgi:membrane protease YdiL (CAAX protease family)
MSLVGQLRIVGYIVWVARRRIGAPPPVPSLNAILRALRWLPLTAPGVFVLIAVVSGAVSYSVRRDAAPPADGWMQIMEGASRGGIIGFIFLALIGAPIAEELSFRGLLYNKLRQEVPGFVAIPLQAAVFGLLHYPLGVSMVWGTAAAGLAFGLMYR